MQIPILSKTVSAEFRRAFDPFTLDAGVRVSRSYPLRYSTAIRVPVAGVSVDFGIQVSGDGWHAVAGSRFVGYFNFREPNVRKSSVERRVYEIADRALFDDMVTRNNVIATREPRPPADLAGMGVHPAFQDDFRARFAATFPGFPGEVWMRYRELEDVAWWARFMGERWPRFVELLVESVRTRGLPA